MKTILAIITSALVLVNPVGTEERNERLEFFA
jgi:hypothetical protein